MKKCIIIAPLAPNKIKNHINITKDDLIVCADKGYEIAVKQGITPHAVIGDFDSLSIKKEEISKTVKWIGYNKEKDETDTFLCYQYGMEKGYDSFVLLGGIGGRADHSYANIQTMAHGVQKGYKFKIIVEKNEIEIFPPGIWKIKEKKGWKLSVFSYGEKVSNVNLTGVKYPIHQGTLSWDFPIGVSNEWEEPFALLTFTEGFLLVILSNEE